MSRFPNLQYPPFSQASIPEAPQPSRLQLPTPSENFTISASWALSLFQENGEFLLTGRTTGGSEIALHVLQSEEQMFLRRLRKHDNKNSEWVEADIGCMSALGAFGLVPRSVAAANSKQDKRHIKYLEEENERLKADNTALKEELERRDITEGSGHEMPRPQVSQKDEGHANKRFKEEDDSSSAYSFRTCSSNGSISAYTRTTVPHQWHYPNYDKPASNRTGKRFAVSDTSPIVINGKLAPRPVMVQPPKFGDTTVTPDCLIHQYFAVRKYKEAINEEFRNVYAKLPSVINGRVDDDLSDDELVKTTAMLVDEVPRDSNIEHRPNLYVKRNEIWCRWAAAAVIWIARDKDVRSVTKFFEAVKKVTTTPFRRPALCAALVFRDIAAATPDELWKHFPLTQSVLGVGERKDWHIVVSKYKAAIENDAEVYYRSWKMSLIVIDE